MSSYTSLIFSYISMHTIMLGLGYNLILQLGWSHKEHGQELLNVQMTPVMQNRDLHQF